MSKNEIVKKNRQLNNNVWYGGFVLFVWILIVSINYFFYS